MGLNMKSDFQDWRVLVADHSPTMARLIKKYLVDLGVNPDRITLARDGNQAFLYSDLSPFDLVTASMHMEWKSGLELLSLLRASPQEHQQTLRFLMISSDASPQVLADLMSRGGNGFLKKPFQPEDLRDTLTALAGSPAGHFVSLNGSQRKTPLVSSATCGTGGPEDIPDGLIQVFIQSAQEGLGQYMVQARAGECRRGAVTGDLISTIAITDAQAGLKVRLRLTFPEAAANAIYAALFGEVDPAMVSGLIGELGNIIGGSVKPRLDEWAGDIFRLVFPERDGASVPETLSLDLGFPETFWTKDSGPAPEGKDSAGHFTVPFQLETGEMLMQVGFQPL